MVEMDNQLSELFSKVIKKHNNLHLVGSKDTTIGHSLCIGNPGHGKTSSNRREVEIRVSKGHKIFCLYDAGRMDLAYFMFPSVSDFWKVPKLDGKRIIAAKAYKTTLLYPVTKNIPKKLPYNAIPFTIGINDLDENDFTSLVGISGKETIKSALYYMEKHVDEFTTPNDYLNIMGDALKSSEDRDKIKPSHFAVKKLKGDALQPLINEGLLTSGSQQTCLDLRELARDKKTIHVLVLKHCPQNLWGFLVHYFMNHLFKILGGLDNEKRIKQKTTFVLNEVADLLDVSAETGSSSEAISNMIGKIAKQSRTSNIFMLMDTQLPQQLPDIKDTMQRIYVFNSGLAEAQKAMEIIGISQRTGEITGEDLMLIPRLPRGYYYLFDKTFGVSMHKLVWTRSRSYLDGEDFYDIYEKVFGQSSYTNITEILNKIRKERTDSEELWRKRDEMVKESKRAAEDKKKELDKDKKEIEKIKKSDTVDKDIPSKKISRKPSLKNSGENDRSSFSVSTAESNSNEVIPEEVIITEVKPAEVKTKTNSEENVNWGEFKKIIKTY
jgi:hypothetical protein